MDFKYRSKGRWWGLLLVVTGVFLVLSQIGIIPKLSLSLILGCLLLARAFVKLCYLDFRNIATVILMGLWFLSYRQGPLHHILGQTNWIVFLLAGLLIDGGVKYIFRQRFRRYGSFSNMRNKSYKKRKSSFDKIIIDVDVDDGDEYTFQDSHDDSEIGRAHV